MVIALAPRRHPASPWTWPSLVFTLSLALASPGFAQQTKPGDPPAQKGGTTKGEATKGAASKDKDDDDDGPDGASKEEREKTGVVDVKAGPKVEPVELFADPRAKAALGNFPELFGSVFAKAEDDRAIEAMSQGGPVDAAIITRYLQTQANRLTKKAYLQAMLDPDSKSNDARQIELATNRLLKPLLVTPSGQNAGFRRTYTDQLLAITPQLLANHLFAREAIMIVLSEAGAQAAVPIYIQTLNDPEQLLQVKDRAAFGIFRAARAGALQGKQTNDAAAALAGFLDREPEAFYFVKLRVLEALGALRVASSAPARGKPEVALAALRLLADPKEKLDVRAYAAQALGLIQPGSIPGYNYPLIAHEIARASLDIGRKLLDVRERQPLMANRLNVFLMMMVEALSGTSSIPGSGLSNASPDAVAPYESKVRSVFAASVDYNRAIRAQLPIKKKALEAALNDLKAAVEKKPPTDRALVPGGDPLTVAGAPATGQK